MLPPFRKYDDAIAPPSWAFVKNPLMQTVEAWDKVLGRPPRCLEWNSDLYKRMGAPEALVSQPPLLDKTQIIKFHIGNEQDNSRLSRTPNVAVNVIGRREVLSPGYKDYERSLETATAKFQKRVAFVIGNCDEAAEYKISFTPVNTVLNLMDRLAVKVVLNTISTGTMVMMGRVMGNWMSWVDVTNKKLKDRAIRLISDICGISYKEACYSLHESLVELKDYNASDKEKPSPVQFTIRKIKAEV
jgi:N-acetylmuramic acid 6-phosphate etherase